MKKEEQKFFFEEKLIILLIFISMAIILVKIVVGAINPESGKLVEGYATNFIGWIVLFSLPYAIKKGALLNIDIISSRYPKEVNEKIGLLIQVIIAIIMIIFTINSVTFFIDSLNNNEMDMFRKIINIGPLLAFALAAIRAIQNIMNRGDR